MCRHKHNITIDPYCSFCGLEESRDHLFFECVFSSLIWSTAMLSSGKASSVPCSWAQLVEWGEHSLKRNTKIKTHAKLVFQACIYYIWLERNAKFHMQQCRSVDSLLHFIFQNVWARLISMEWRCFWLSMFLI